MTIKILSRDLIDKISAGEVIERPASIIKELVENSIDAQSSSIEVHINDAGKKLISVKDNGLGIAKEELTLAIRAYCTSKLTQENLFNIQTLGFRGEALASITAVSNLLLASKQNDANGGWSIGNHKGENYSIDPFPISQGTYIKVENLFYNTPARLKFLRSNNTENLASYKLFKNLSLSKPDIAFNLFVDGKEIYNYHNNSLNQLESRVCQILGDAFVSNSIYFEDANPMFKIYGYLASPTWTKKNSDYQYFFVNGRVLRDKFLSQLLKIAYGNVLFNGAYPCYVIFLEINPTEIDVNVNPTKSEVRFKDINLIKHLIVDIIKKNLSKTSNQHNTDEIGRKLLFNNNANFSSSYTLKDSAQGNILNSLNYNSPNDQFVFEDIIQDKTKDYPLGIAKAQFHNNWILSETKDGFVIVDQHAAHERINQELLVKNYLLNNKIASQLLLTQEFITINSEEYEVLREFKNPLILLGMDFDFFSNNSVVVKSLPAIMKNPNAKILFKDIIGDLLHLQSLEDFNMKLYDIVATIACHKSIRSGDSLTIMEMNDLLRKMEQTPNYGQCPHGRPTFSTFKLKDIETLFGRS